jgi:hypothetical protein
MKTSKNAVLSDMKQSKMALPIAAQPLAVDDIPPELKDWLVRLRLLHDVPFAYFVADTQLLPEESIRWFYLDRRWTDALVQGALSVGTVNTDDRLQLTDRYDQVRAALDEAERNYRRQDGEPELTGGAGPVSGFILRSRAVAGWPGLHVRAFKDEPTEGDGFNYPDDHPLRMRLLRLERLAPAVLLCLFDGIPKEVHVQEPRHGVQFGVDMTPGAGGTLRATLPVRDPDIGVDPLPVSVDVRFRPNASGVIDIQRLSSSLAANGGAGADATLDSAEFALQMIRFPYRRIFGDPDRLHVSTTIVLKPSVQYSALVTTVFQRGVTP